MSIDRWTCGHDSGATCAQCYHDLAEKAAAMQAMLDAIAERADRGGRRIETAMEACEAIEAMARKRFAR